MQSDSAPRGDSDNPPARAEGSEVGAPGESTSPPRAPLLDATDANFAPHSAIIETSLKSADASTDGRSRGAFTSSCVTRSTCGFRGKFGVEDGSIDIHFDQLSTFLCGTLYLVAECIRHPLVVRSYPASSKEKMEGQLSYCMPYTLLVCGR